MGKGHELKSGKNVVFAAGTGMICFVDLIAHLIHKRIAENGGLNMFDDTQSSLPDDFSLELHTSFQSEDEAVVVNLRVDDSRE